MATQNNNIPQRIADAIPTLANHSVGILWDGESGIDEHGFTSSDNLVLGADMPNANDLRSFMLAGGAGRQTCLDIVKKKSVAITDMEPVLIERMEQALADSLSTVLHFASFHAQENSSNVMVSLKTTSVHGRTFIVSNTELSLFYTDELVEHYDFDFLALAEEVLVSILEESGFFIQRLGTSGFLGMNGSISNADRSFRVSWYDPEVCEHSREANDASQVDAWRVGVPLGDVFA